MCIPSPPAAASRTPQREAVPDSALPDLEGEKLNSQGGSMPLCFLPQFTPLGGHGELPVHLHGQDIEPRPAFNTLRPKAFAKTTVSGFSGKTMGMSPPSGPMASSRISSPGAAISRQYRSRMGGYRKTSQEDTPGRRSSHPQAADRAATSAVSCRRLETCR